MNSKDKRSLWSNSSRARYFLVPHDQELPAGDFVICTLSGDEKKVAPATLASFEITEDEAKAYVEAEMNQVLDQAKSAFSNILAFSVKTAPEEIPSTPTTSSDKSQLALNVICTLLGITPEELQHNPETVQKGFLNLSIQMKEVIQGSVSEDPAQLDAARARMRSLQATLQAHSVNVGASLEELPDRLHSLYFSSDHQQYLKEITDKLQQWAEQIEQSSTADGLSIEEALLAFSKSFPELFIEENESSLQEKREQEYRESAREAIARSRSAYKMPSLDFGDLMSEANQQPEDDFK